MRLNVSFIYTQNWISSFRGHFLIYTVVMFRYFVRTLPRNVISSFTGWKVLVLVAAFGSTYIIVTSGLDWQYLLAVRDPDLNKMFFPAVIIGAFIPVSLPLFLIVVGKLFNRIKVETTGWAMGQAALIGSIVSSMLKAFTGRLPPNLHDLMADSSHGFQFGFLHHGIFWGWPSSHTTIAFAMAFALVALFPKNKHILFYSVLYAFYIGIGVSLSIHWFSEFIAGAFIGTAIGMTVGSSFSKTLRSR